MIELIAGIIFIVVVFALADLGFRFMDGGLR